MKLDPPDADSVEAEIERITPRPAERRAPELRAVERREGDRRQAERRGMEALRAEALQAVMSKVEDRNFGGLRSAIDWRPRLAIPASRLLLLAVALLAGGLAAFLATRRDEPPVAALATTAEASASSAVVIPMARVLTARTDIAAGDRVTAEALDWMDWPEANLNADFITEAASPNAIADISGSAARADILAGEPLRKARLAAADGSFLAAILDKGMRAVSISVAAEAASGGFVAPNDRVDVVLTVTNGDRHDVQTILSGIQVLAINGRVGRGSSQAPAPEGEAAPQSTEAFANQAIATLALDQRQAELVIAASGMGKLSLALRPVGGLPESEATAAERAANATIRLTSPFWTAAPGPR